MMGKLSRRLPGVQNASLAKTAKQFTSEIMGKYPSISIRAVVNLETLSYETVSTPVELYSVQRLSL